MEPSAAISDSSYRRAGGGPSSSSSSATSASNNSPTNTNTNTSSSSSARYGGGGLHHFTAYDFIHAPLSTILEYSGILLRSPPNHPDSHSLLTTTTTTTLSSPPAAYTPHSPNTTPTHDFSTPLANGGSGAEVSIRIIGATEPENATPLGGASSPSPIIPQPPLQNQVPNQSVSRAASAPSLVPSSHFQRADPRVAERDPQSVNASLNAESPDAAGVNHNRNSSYQRYDIQHAARWIEQVLPFSLLLLVVFIRQHLQGFFVTIWIAAFMFKSNDIIRKQTALKGERKVSVLFGISLVFTFHVVGLYWWYWNDELPYPLVMLPPKAVPPFWHAIFIIVVNDALVRQSAMVLKCILLMYYKNSRGKNYRKQGQMLTLVEYLLLLYRALLPAPVWYRFFLNKEYGSLFSSLMTGLYLTFKLTSVVEKVQSLLAALKVLSCKEIHYGSYATSEQVTAAGDLCAICQEKMHSPILLRCKHIFCEDCVSEWFERERTCPLCRALVKPAELRSFSDGSTSLFFQLF